MCKYLIISTNGTGQCGLATQQGCPPQVKSKIREAFKEAALRNNPELNKGLGIAGGPPNCMFYNSPYVQWNDCPEYTP
jgi:hypothetical protein